jgi:hypothetical protein
MAELVRDHQLGEVVWDDDLANICFADLQSAENNCWQFAERPLNGGTRQPPPSQSNSAPAGRGASTT